MVEKEKFQEKLGAALGLKMAAQKAVEELGSRRLLDKNGMLTQLKKCNRKLVIISQSSKK